MEYGIFLATFVNGPKNYDGDDWVYPGCVKYRYDFISAMAADAKLACRKLKWLHHDGQTWYAFFHPASKVKIDSVLGSLFDKNKVRRSPVHTLMSYRIFNNSVTKKIYRLFKGR